MAQLTLLIGGRASCERSLQAWLALRHADVRFDVDSFSTAHRNISVDGLYGKAPPVLLVDNVPIWGVLPIGEFLAEHLPVLWPKEPRARALARAVAAEALEGLNAIRAFLPFDLTRRFTSPRLVRIVQEEVSRLATVWEACRVEFGAGGPYLFGEFSLADAVHAGPAMRLVGNSICLHGEAAFYLQTMATLPTVIEWIGRAAEDGRETNRERPAPVDVGNQAISELSPIEEEMVPTEALAGRQQRNSEGYDAGVKPIGAGIHRRH